jgi:hypothetical protein
MGIDSHVPVLKGQGHFFEKALVPFTIDVPLGLRETKKQAT